MVHTVFVFVKELIVMFMQCFCHFLLITGSVVLGCINNEINAGAEILLTFSGLVLMWTGLGASCGG